MVSAALLATSRTSGANTANTYTTSLVDRVTETARASELSLPLGGYYVSESSAVATLVAGTDAVTVVDVTETTETDA